MKHVLKEFALIIVCIVSLMTIYATYDIIYSEDKKQSKIELLKLTIDASSLNYEIKVVKFHSKKGKITPKQLDSLRIESNKETTNLIIKIINKNE